MGFGGRVHGLVQKVQFDAKVYFDPYASPKPHKHIGNAPRASRKLKKSKKTALISIKYIEHIEDQYEENIDFLESPAGLEPLGGV